MKLLQYLLTELIAEFIFCKVTDTDNHTYLLYPLILTFPSSFSPFKYYVNCQTKQCQLKVISDTDTLHQTTHKNTVDKLKIYSDLLITRGEFEREICKITSL